MEELLVRCFLIGRRNNNTSLFIIISHCFTVKLSNQLTFWPKKIAIAGLNNHHRCTYHINWPLGSAFVFVY